MFKKENRLTTVFILVILFFVGVAIWGAFSDNGAEKVAALPTSTDKVFDESEQPVIGNEDAPVEMVVFTDFQCPHCKTWSEEAYPELKAKLIDPGKAKITFVNYPVIGTPSIYAAMASEYVYKENPDEWYAFTQELYANQNALDNATISALASEYLDGVTAEEIEEKLEEDQIYIDDALSDLKYGEDIGVTGTPYLLVNGENVENHGDVDAIVELVDETINKASE